MSSNLNFMYSKREDFIAIGKVIGVHGTRGWVKVVVYSERLDRLDNVSVVSFEDEAGIKGEIVSNVSTKSGQVLLKLKSVSDRETAKNFIGSELLLPNEEQLKLPENTYFIHDLIGIQVFDTEGEFLGQIDEILTMGGNDIYVVRNGREFLIPAVSEFIKNIDLENGRMQVHLWEEM